MDQTHQLMFSKYLKRQLPRALRNILLIDRPSVQRFCFIHFPKEEGQNCRHTAKFQSKHCTVCVLERSFARLLRSSISGAPVMHTCIFSSRVCRLVMDTLNACISFAATVCTSCSGSNSSFHKTVLSSKQSRTRSC